MKFNNTEVFNFEGALRGMRNPMNSWDKSDSEYRGGNYNIGENDIKLAQRLVKGGTEHCKFVRQIMISVDITAPLYWWKEFDTYKVGTTANSTSSMHKLSTTPITLECFEIDDYDKDLIFEQGVDYEQSQDLDISSFADSLIMDLESLRLKYLETKDIKYWKELIRWLPESWLQTRTITMNYENVRNMYNQRVKHPHKLTEWRNSFGEWVESLPYSKELIMLDKTN